ncbi:MAG: response regulator transcription factor [Bacteroidetes bacterium]|nr:response regulator transcription factor [Bacteroidota bacterium]
MDKPIDILILDDERDAWEYLQSMLRMQVPDVGRLLATSSMDEASEFMIHVKPQLLFLDVEMPGMNGFEFLRMQKEKNFGVIFTTAYSKYAIQAIRFSAIDFLLKPVQVDEFKDAVQRFRNAMQHSPLLERYSHLFENLAKTNEREFKISLTKSNRQFLIAPADFFYCTADDNYTRLYLIDNTEFLLSRTLRDIEEMLTPHDFIRIHKSTLVNKHKIQSLSNERILTLENGVQLEVSRRRIAQVRELLI